MQEACRVIIILGAGGFAREAYWHIRETWPTAKILFVDDVTDTTELVMCGEKIPVVKDWRFEAFLSSGPGRCEDSSFGFVIGVGNPQAKRILVKKAIESGLKPFPTVIHPRALVQGHDCRIGVGGIITPGCVVTTNVSIGDYVLINLNCTVGHDAALGDYVTCNPGCCISGNVTLGEGVVLGTGTVIREKISVAAGVVTGAQTCVVKNIDEPGITVAGVPAKKLA